MVIGVSEPGPESSILSLTACSLPLLHNRSAGARFVAKWAVDRGTALGSSVLGEQGQLHILSMNHKSKDTASQVCHKTADISLLTVGELL